MSVGPRRRDNPIRDWGVRLGVLAGESTGGGVGREQRRQAPTSTMPEAGEATSATWWADDATGSLDMTSMFSHMFHPPVWSPMLWVVRWQINTLSSPAGTCQVRFTTSTVDRLVQMPIEPMSNPGASGQASWTEFTTGEFSDPVTVYVYGPTGATGTAQVGLAAVGL